MIFNVCDEKRVFRKFNFTLIVSWMIALEDLITDTKNRKCKIMDWINIF